MHAKKYTIKSYLNEFNFIIQNMRNIIIIINDEDSFFIIVLLSLFYKLCCAFMLYERYFGLQKMLMTLEQRIDHS